MYTPKTVEQSLRYLYRGAIHEQDYNERAVESLLGMLDFHALAQLLRHQAEHVQTFITKSKCPLALDYRSRDLFNQRAALIYEDTDQFSQGIVNTSRVFELWLLENGNFSCVSCVTVNFLHGSFVAQYREERGCPWEAGMWISLEDLTAGLEDACEQVYRAEIPLYEL